jgi:diguanylate cyclase (GGDEF)-like protein
MTASPFDTLAAPDATTTVDRANISVQHVFQRLGQRRQWLGLVYASHLVDTGILTLYAWLDVTTFVVPAAYIAAATALCVSFLVLSEADFPRKTDDYHLPVWQLFANGGLLVVFAEAVPELAFQFWCTLFVVYGFSSLRLTAREALVSLLLVGLSLLSFFVLDDHPIGIPSNNVAERAVSALFLLLTLARCTALGLYANELRMSLYRRGKQLKAAVQRIEEIAEVDELTGLFNRRSITRALEAEIARAQRSASPSCIALIDIDWFKSINDKFGHPAGDEALRTFAINIAANIRTIDKLGRYGGEEFLLILPETSEQSAEKLLNRLRIIVASLDWNDITPGSALTFSAGVAQIRSAETAESLIERADTALYDSKQWGRNCVKVAA